MLPKSVESIEGYAFYDCKNLEDITLNDGLLSIGRWAFSNCNKLSSISIPPSVIEIEDNAFGYDYSKLMSESSAVTIAGAQDYPKVDSFKIYCYKGTAGEDYVINNDFDYEYLDVEPTEVATVAPTEAKTEPSSEPESVIEATTGSSTVQPIAEPSNRVPVQNNNIAYIIVIVVELIIILALLAVIIMMALKKKKSI